MYATKAEIARLFSVSPTTVYSRVEGIQAEIGKRYNQYAILDNLISVAVYADYEKYRKMLSDKNLRKYVPIFDKNAAEQYVNKPPKSKKIEKVIVTESKQVNAILVVAVENKKMEKIVEYINKEIG